MGGLHWVNALLRLHSRYWRLSESPAHSAQDHSEQLVSVLEAFWGLRRLSLQFGLGDGVWGAVWSSTAVCDETGKGEVGVLPEAPVPGREAWMLSLW